jgi:hypothetical protein
MNPKRYFSRESRAGNSTSFGFANDTIVLAFESRQARDKYVEQSRNLSCMAIRASEATKEAANVSLTGNHNGKPRPYLYQCWVIERWGAIHHLGGDALREAFSCLGSLEIGSTLDCEHAARFYR